MEDTPMAVCYNHPDRRTRITCQRCGRPICGECMIPASVGFQCPDCVKKGLKQTRQNQGPFGGTLTNNPRTTSIVLIVINFIVWGIIQLSAFIGSKAQLVNTLGLIPVGICTGPGNTFYPNAGQAALCATLPDATWMPGVASGAWWQLFTSIFTHENILHIAMNCLTLWFLGPPLESVLGRARFLVTYIVSGLVGSMFIMWLSPEYSTSIGGSGALFGLMGALLIVAWRRHLDMRQLLLWLGLNIVFTFVGGGSISWQAHLGGLVGGVLIALIWTLLGSRKITAQWVLVAAMVVAIAAGTVARVMMLTP